MKVLAALSVALGLGFGAASAAPIDPNPITSDYYIEHNGLLWAWASPISTEFFGQNVLYLPGIQEGWRFATGDEWAARPDDSDFGGKCASRFWNSFYTHCDFGDGANGYVSNVWDGSIRELWYVSGDLTPDDVPAPAGLALLGLGLLGLGLARRKR